MLPAAHRMRHAHDFRTAIRRGRRAGRGGVVVHLASGPSTVASPSSPVEGGDVVVHEETRVGFVVPKAVGNAVVRNTVKRRLRALARERVARLADGSLLVVRATPSSAALTSVALAADLDAALAAAQRSDQRGGRRG